MNIVFVRHRSDQQQTYCFKVPDSLLPYMQRPCGFQVKCDTIRGIQKGVVVSDLLSYEDASSEIKKAHAKSPLRSIVSVVTSVPLDEIKIAPGFAQTTPSVRKLAKRRREYQQNGRFYTRVAVNASGYLTDGYTAYLASKGFGLSKLRCILEA